jgi:hypothetical protein
MEPYNISVKIGNALSLWQEYQDKQDAESWDRYVDQSLIDYRTDGIALDKKLNEAQIKEIDSRIAKNNADTWKIYHPSGGGTNTPGTMTTTDAQKLLNTKASLLADIAKWTNAITKGTYFDMELGREVTIDPTTAQMNLDNAKAELSLHGGDFLNASIAIVASWDPEQAEMMQNFKDEIYSTFGATSDNDLTYQNVKEVYDNATITDNKTGATTKLTEYLQTHGYKNFLSLIPGWISGLPNVWHPRGGTP